MPKSHESLNRINSNYLWIGEDDNLHVCMPFLEMQDSLIANASDIHTCWEDFFGFSSNRRSIFSELDAYIKIAELIKNSCAPGDDISGFEKRLKQASAYRNFFEQIKSLSDSQRLETFKKLFAAHNTSVYSMLLSPQEPSGSSMAKYIDHTFSLNDDGPASLPSQLRNLYDDKKQRKVTPTLDAIAVQFFLGLVNVYCKSTQMSDNNFGKTLEESDQLKDGLISSLSCDFQAREEEALLSFINQNREHFDLTRDFTEDEKNHLINEFHKKISYIRRDVEPTNYRELILFQNDQTNKNFFLHEGRMYCDAIRVAQEAGIPTDSNEFIRDIEPLTIVDPLNREKMIFKLPEYTATIDMTQLADSTGDPIALTDTLRQLNLRDQLALMNALGKKIDDITGYFPSFFFLVRETVSYETATALLFDNEIIKYVYHLTHILNLLDQDQRSVLIKKLDFDKNIKTMYELKSILEICTPDEQISAIENLASTINRVVTSSGEAQYILAALKTENQMTFIGKLDLEKVCNNFPALALTLTIISLPGQQIHLIEKLGDKINTLIFSGDALAYVLKNLLDAQVKISLINQLDFNRIRIDHSNLTSILKLLDQDQRSVLIKKLDFEKVCNNFPTLALTLTIISLPGQQIHLIEKLGDKINTLIFSGGALAYVLKNLLDAQVKMFLIKQLDFNKIYIYCDSLTSILKLLDQDQKSVLIEKLDFNKISIDCESLISILKALDQDQQSVLIEKLWHNIGEFIIVDRDRYKLPNLLKIIPKEKQIPLIKKLRDKRQGPVVNSGSELVNVLKNLDPSNWTLLINVLNLDMIFILKSFNQNQRSVLIEKLDFNQIFIFFPCGLKSILALLNEAGQAVLIEKLENEIGRLIRVNDDLIDALKSLLPKAQITLIQKLGDNLSRVARNYNELIEVLTNLDRKGKMIFIEKLGNTLHTVIKTSDQVTQLLKNLDNTLNFDELILILNLLNNTLLTRSVIGNLKDDLFAVIMNFDQMFKVLEKSNMKTYYILIERLDLNKIIKTHDQLISILKKIEDPDARKLLLEKLDFNNIISSFDHLVDILKVLEKKEKTDLIKKLKDTLHTLIKVPDQVTQLLKNLDNTLTFDELILILKQLDQPLGRGVIQELGRNLSAVIINYDQVTNVLENLDREGKMIFIEKLGLGYLWNLPSLPKPMPKLIGDIFRTLRPEQRISQAIDLLSNPYNRFNFFQRSEQTRLTAVLSQKYSSFLELSTAINYSVPHISQTNALKEKWEFITSMFEEASSPSNHPPAEAAKPLASPMIEEADDQFAEAAKLLASRPDKKVPQRKVEVEEIELENLKP